MSVKEFQQEHAVNIACEGKYTLHRWLDPNGKIVWYHRDDRELDFYRARLSADGKSLWAANAFGHTLARFDTESKALVAEVELGVDTYPYGLALDEKSGKIYVSLWGAGKVAVVDIKANAVQSHYETQEHPNEMITAKQGQYLFVANANRNTVTVLDTKQGQAVETINTAIAPDAPAGSTPSSSIARPATGRSLTPMSWTSVSRTPVGTRPAGRWSTGVCRWRDPRC